jgi:SAM-dependent methyltransferase
MLKLWRRVRYIATTGLRRRVRDVLLAPRRGAARRRVFVAREDLARRYLSGSGIEIGALGFPLRVPPGVAVRYVDHLPREELIAFNRRSFELAHIDAQAIPPVDVVDDGGTLPTFADASLDFVIANHVLEHIEDPVDALANWLRVLRGGGVLFLSLPDARRTYDAPRERTSVEHVLRDHREGPQTSRREHYEEWARILDAVPAERVAARAEEFAAEDARHHFHVWELEGFLALLHTLALPCDLELAQANEAEFAVVLRRRDEEA